MSSNDEQFSKNLARLNVLCGPGWRWEIVRARREHLDAFDVPIRRGQNYFRKRFSNGFDDCLKLSLKSMEILLFAVVGSNPFLQILADRLADKEQEAISAAVHRISL